jgi:hypothetical protein
VSKNFEKTICEQLCAYFDSIFNHFLCAFRKGHGCQTILLKILEDWKDALDKNIYAAAILMDLSKAFDCLPHNILLEKLSAYGLKKKSVNLLASYLIRTGNNKLRLVKFLAAGITSAREYPRAVYLARFYSTFLSMIFSILLNMEHCTTTQMTIRCLWLALTSII